MRKTILASISATALLALSACGDAVESDDASVEGEADAESGDAMAEEGDAMAEDGDAMAEEGDAMAEDSEAMAEEGEAMTEEAAEEEGGNSISISTDGVEANVEGVSVSAGTDGDVTVE